MWRVCKYVSVREYKQNCPFASFLFDLRNFQNNKQNKKNSPFFLILPFFPLVHKVLSVLEAILSVYNFLLFGCVSVTFI